MPKIDIAKIPVDTVCMYPEPFWQPIVATLKSQFRVITADARGIAASTRGKNGDSHYFP